MYSLMVTKDWVVTLEEFLVYSYSIQKRQPRGLAILELFLVIFCQLHINLSQKLDANSYFEVLNIIKC